MALAASGLFCVDITAIFSLFIRCVGKALHEEVPYQLKGRCRSRQSSYASQISMDHPAPHVEPDVHSCRRRLLDQADRIIKQDLVVADMHTERRQPLEISVKG